MQKYQVFTPVNVVKKMLRLIGYFGPKIFFSKIADIYCGDGVFLIEALKKYIKVCKSLNISSETIAKQCNNNFYGFEIDQTLVFSCRKNLNNVLYHETGLTVEWINIKCCNGLTEPISGIGFILGNPPYISYLEMKKETRNQLRNHYVSCRHGKFDYSYAFIERSINCLSNDGKACIIAPSNIYKIEAAKLLRNYFYPYLSKIVEYIDNNPFKGKALTNPSISLFVKRKTDSYAYSGKCERKVKKTGDFTSDLGLFRFSSFENKRFGDYFDIGCSIATLCNEAFIVNENTIKYENLEASLLKNAISSKCVRYGVKNKIIFPYLFKNNSLVRLKENEFMSLYPNIYNYLSRFKKKLIQRDADKNAKWFEYGRSQAIYKMNKKKLLVSSILTNRVRVIELTENDLPYAGCYIIHKDGSEYSLEDAKNILTSKKLFEYLKKHGIKMNGNSFRFSCKILKDFKFGV